MVHLFAYAKLKKAYDPPKDSKNHKKDAIFADLYDFGNDAGAINIGKTKALAIGESMQIHESDFKYLDREESPQYRRVKTKTLRGEKAYVYEFIGKLPKNAKKIVEWKG